MNLDAENILNISTWIMISSSVVTFVSTFFIKAPYGRYSATESKGWGPLVEARLAWILMECQNLIIVGGYLYYAYTLGLHVPLPNLLLLGLFSIHYTQV